MRDLDRRNDDDTKLDKDDDLIRKTPNGFILQKQNFDWLEKPETSVDPSAVRPFSNFRATLKTVKGPKVK